MHSLNTFSAIALAVGALLSACPAWAQDTETASSAPSASSVDGSAQARAWYERGVKLALEKRFLEAQVEFERALRKDPPLEAYFGMGQVELALGRPCEALDAYSKYLEFGGAHVSDEKRRGVENHMRQLRQGGGSEERCHPKQRMGMLIVQCDRSDVLLRVDGRNLVIDENLGHRLKAGRHEVVFRDRSGDTAPVIIDIDPGSVHYLQCAAQPKATSLSAPNAEKPGLSGQQTAGLVVAGAGVGLALATLGHYLWNHGRHDAWKSDHERLAQEGGSLEEQKANNALGSSIQKANQVTLGLAIASGVLAGTGLTIFLLSPKQNVGTQTQMSLVRTSSKSRALRSSLSAELHATSAALAWSGSW